MNSDIEHTLAQVSEVCDHYVQADRLPSAFRGSDVRAILLGTDPGTFNGKRFEYVFCLERGVNSPYFRQFLPNLRMVGLDLNRIYVQNLCRNYFDRDTLSHRDHWLRCAALWIGPLKDELDSLDPSQTIPILISAHILLEVLCKDKCEEPEYYYRHSTFVEGNDNLVQRTLIPFFRGGGEKYKFSDQSWPNYAGRISKRVAQNFA